jgi:hypothetical protein
MDDFLERAYAKDPLLKFSLYTVVQVESLKLVGNEILSLSNDLATNSSALMRSTSLFWLWVLGAYEVVRVMDQSKASFSEALQEEVHYQKTTLAKIRIPFAKQEMQGRKKIPVYAELSVIGIDRGLKYEISGEIYNSSAIIENFFAFIDKIDSANITGELPVRRR